MLTFDTKCTLPPEGVGFVTSPDVRGTLEILWGCGTVLLICTWSILHLNVPIQTVLDPGNKKQRYIRSVSRFATKVKWMVINLVAPEWSLGKALSDYRNVKVLDERFKEYSKIDGVPWTASHTYLANMGGFAVRFRPVDDASEPKTRSPSSPPSPTSPPDQAPAAPMYESPALVATGRGYASRPVPSSVRDHLEGILSVGKVSRAKIEERMGKQAGRVTWRPDDQNVALVSETVRTLDLAWFLDEWEENLFDLDALYDWFTNLHALQGDIWILDAQQLLLARDMGIVDKLPSLGLDDIEDRNKGDVFVKLVATAQIVWFVVQMVARRCNQLPTTQLEVMTLSFALSNAITFALLLNKPKDLAYTIELSGLRGQITPQNLARLALFGPTYWFWDRTSVWVPNHALHLDCVRGRGIQDRSWTFALGAGLSGLVFGSAHCIAWNFYFPTEPERIVWEISSVLTAATVPLMLVLSMYMSWAQRPADVASGCWSGTREQTAKLIPLVAMFIFVATRIFLIFEVIRSLAFQQPLTFQTTWSANLPHLG
ncbi:hypothetical protein QBC47DRAFT_389369 [Echria macrotheca]|uniref:Uncharacterized protein n=1 Tax=Echria macrotheca TaxID=438768 RepID=A0AAJ0B5D8_9PEZI|nr:hypothetical protein QBC47DRAFT_389369 [Echria macrotheca]